MASSDRVFKLAQLAQAAGVSPRTVRYYIQRGLLPAPGFRGADTTYGEEHLRRLGVIRRLQDLFWPLDAIGRALEAPDPRWLDEVLAGGEPGPPISVDVPDKPVVPDNGEAWWRLVLAPGVELHVTADARERHASWLARVVALGPP
ncbi:MAG: MerR family transcriptional regulator [Candidatus Sericytochromatia bacterium]|nr:MerR family transcriptional regulator [Candidatus Sericytochromatia bacterium]